MLNEHLTQIVRTPEVLGAKEGLLCLHPVLPLSGTNRQRLKEQSHPALAMYDLHIWPHITEGKSQGWPTLSATCQEEEGAGH